MIKKTGSNYEAGLRCYSLKTKHDRNVFILFRLQSATLR